MIYRICQIAQDKDAKGRGKFFYEFFHDRSSAYDADVPGMWRFLLFAWEERIVIFSAHDSFFRDVIR